MNLIRSNLNKKLFIWFILYLIFYILIGKNIFQHGMFFDGLTYSSISRNLSQNIGELWKPYYTDTLHSEFYEHPPFALYIQSLFFKLFGDNYFTEKIYCFFIYILSGLVLYKIIRQLKVDNHKHSFFLIILFWTTIPVNFWSFNNNILEITLVPILLLSFLFSYYAVCAKKTKVVYVYVLSSSLFMCLGFLTKGFVALFPLFFYLFFYVSKLHAFFNSRKMLIYSALNMLFLFVFIAVIFLNDKTSYFFKRYLNQQVFKSVIGERELSNSRFEILEQLFYQLLPLFIIYIFVNLYFYKKFTIKKLNSKSTIFLLIGISSSIPLIVSPKLREFYLIPSLPFYVLSIYFSMEDELVLLINSSSKYFKRYYLFFNATLILIFFISITHQIINLGGAYRDNEVIETVLTLKNHLPPREVISCSETLKNDWRLHAYFQRYLKVSIDRDHNRKCRFLIINADEKVKNEQKMIMIKNDNYKLLKI